MKKRPFQLRDFYIGWQASAPEIFAVHIRKFIAFLTVLLLLYAAVLVLSQRGFENSVFEYGNLSILEGTLVTSPVPMLKIAGTGDTHSVLLVGAGKRGAGEDLMKIEANLGSALAGKRIRLRGTRIYHDGKWLLELTEGPGSFDGLSGFDQIPAAGRTRDHGFVTLRGEIYDPKCAFGVMKPGYGKPHRSCAVRCISGGIPPVLKVENAAGKKNYILLLGPDGQPVNREVLPYVADQVQVCGYLQQADDWLVLRTDPSTDILRLQPYWMTGAVPMCVE